MTNKETAEQNLYMATKGATAELEVVAIFNNYNFTLGYYKLSEFAHLGAFTDTTRRIVLGEFSDSIREQVTENESLYDDDVVFAVESGDYDVTYENEGFKIIFDYTKSGNEQN